ncbi:MAG TPA: FKBP-type peptidyl-prolyl cis-trans isomerase [Solirubrobacterales bacterium]|nr:FKBP-type peptidyl-prolyl cis-trans isomerase [Solirubrobacterales bacterium]
MISAAQFSACGGAEENGGSTMRSHSDTVSQESSAAESVEKAYSGDWAGLKRTAGRYADKLVIPRGPAPKQVVIVDLKQGKGPVVQSGDSFYARYVTFGFETGGVSEPYWDSPSTYTAGLGTYKKGWERGIKGIRVGEMRELVVPSEMAYGNGALVYLLQVLKLG